MNNNNQRTNQNEGIPKEKSIAKIEQPSAGSLHSEKTVGIWVRTASLAKEDQTRAKNTEKRAREFAVAKNWRVARVYRLKGVSGIPHPSS